MAISPFLYAKLEYDPLDFETIGMVAYQANVLITRPNIVPGTFKDLLEYLKTNRDKLSFASTGPGGAWDLCAILFKNATGIDIKTVPYRATAPALTDILGGNVDLLCDSVATATPYIQAGSVQAHGVTTLTRASSLPNVPTLDEQGLKGFDMTTWTSLYAPKGTLRPIVDHLSKSLQEAVQDPHFNASLQKVGSSAQPKERATPRPTPPICGRKSTAGVRSSRPRKSVPTDWLSAATAGWRAGRFAFDTRSTASIIAAGLAMPLPAMSWPVPCATEANRIGVPIDSADAAFCAISLSRCGPGRAASPQRRR